MKASVFLATVLAGLALAQQESLLQKHNLPELFSYDHGSHSVAVYRGAALKAAIAAGLVKGFPGSGAGRGGAGDARDGRQLRPAPTPRPTLPPTPAPTHVTHVLGLVWPEFTIGDCSFTDKKLSKFKLYKLC